jgi:hypothetical protein
MEYPKIRKKSIIVNKEDDPKFNQVKNVERIVEKDVFFPQGVHIKDMDLSVIEYVKSEFDVVMSNGDPIPMYVYQQGESRFTEFMQHWENTDSTGTQFLPFGIFIREGNGTQGTLFDQISYNIPTEELYTVQKVPVLENGEKVIKNFKIRQPITVDLSYKMSVFTTLRQDIDAFDEKILFEFSEGQRYINVKGHDMSLKLLSIQDKSTLKLEERRFFQHDYKFMLKGYILNEDYFKEISEFNTLKIQFQTDISKKECFSTIQEFGECEVCYVFFFPRKNQASGITRTISQDISFTYDNKKDPTDYQLLLNGNVVTVPFDANKGDELTLNYLGEFNKDIKIKICGNIRE